jgi:hypothetical protein
MMDLRLTGANQLADLAKDLKSVGDKDLRKELLKGLRNAAKPLAKEVAPRVAREGLPKHGGLNEFVASSKFGVRTRTTGQGAGVRIVGKKGTHDLAAMDRGRLRHPVWKRASERHRSAVWVTQLIEPGWWTKGMSDPVVLEPMREELLKVIDDVTRKLTRG